MLTLLAISPLVVILTLLVVLKWPAKKAMPMAFVFTLILGLFVWEMPVWQVSAATVEGVMVAFSVFWIVLGAIILLQVLQQSGAMVVIKNTFATIHPDKYIILIMITWFFGSFLEGISGFGTPAAICAPLLISVGFRKLESVVLSLIANSCAVAFGALGTPLVIGMKEGLKNTQVDADILIQQVSEKVALVNIFSGSLVPLIILMLYARFFSVEKSWKLGLSYWKPAIIAGLLFTIPSYVFVVFLGPEFATVLGAITGFVLMIIVIRMNWLRIPFSAPFEKEHSIMRSRIAWLPYIIIVVLLLISRLDFLPFKGWFLGTSILWSNIFDTSIDGYLAVLYLPGTFFILAVLIVFPFFKSHMKGRWGKVSKETTSKLIGIVLALFTAVPLVRIFLFSGVNANGYPAMSEVLTSSLQFVPGRIYYVVSIFFGMLGSFLSGSATFSNMMFSEIQYNMAIEDGVSVDWMLAMQSIGANTGNMICITNIIAACSVTSLAGGEGRVLKYVFVPAVIIATLSVLSATGLYYVL